MPSLREFFTKFKRKGPSPYDRPECRRCKYLVDCLATSQQCFDDLLVYRDAKGSIIPPTVEQRAFYGLHQMPCCGAGEFHPGPQGGMSMNVTCCGCGARWNICAPLQMIEKI